MSGPPNKRRRTKAIGPDAPQFAKAFTHKTITTVNRSGIVIKKDVLVPLVPSEPTRDNPSASSSTLPNNEDDNYITQEDEGNVDHPYLLNHDEDITNRNKSKVSILIWVLNKTLIVSQSEATRLPSAIC